ncbi:hypothetical protein Bbelb_444540, partial [Branchiostoma belcheri]
MQRTTLARSVCVAISKELVQDDVDMFPQTGGDHKNVSRGSLYTGDFSPVVTDLADDISAQNTYIVRQAFSDTFIGVDVEDNPGACNRCHGNRKDIYARADRLLIVGGIDEYTTSSWLTQKLTPLLSHHITNSDAYPVRFSGDFLHVRTSMEGYSDSAHKDSVLGLSRLTESVIYLAGPYHDHGHGSAQGPGSSVITQALYQRLTITAEITTTTSGRKKNMTVATSQHNGESDPSSVMSCLGYGAARRNKSAELIAQPAVWRRAKGSTSMFHFNNAIHTVCYAKHFVTTEYSSCLLGDGYNVEQARARGDTGWLPALAVGSHDVLPRAAARTQTYRRIPPTGRRPEFHDIGVGWLGNDPVGMMERRASSKRYKNVYKHNARTDRFLHQRSLCDPPTHRLWETQITLMIDKVLQANYRTPLSNNVKMLIDVSSDFKTTQLAAGVSVRGCGTPVATNPPRPHSFWFPQERAGHFPPAGAPGTISTGRRRSTEEFTGELRCRRGIEEPTKDRLKKELSRGKYALGLLVRKHPWRGRMGYRHMTSSSIGINKPQTCSEGYPTVLHWTPALSALNCPHLPTTQGSEQWRPSQCTEKVS